VTDRGWIRGDLLGGAVAETGMERAHALPLIHVVHQGLAASPRSCRMNAALDLNLKEKGIATCVLVSIGMG
jgi:hypothetical protein